MICAFEYKDVRSPLHARKRRIRPRADPASPTHPGTYIANMGDSTTNTHHQMIRAIGGAQTVYIEAARNRQRESRPRA